MGKGGGVEPGCGLVKEKKSSQALENGGKKTKREATDRPQTAVKLIVYILVYLS